MGYMQLQITGKQEWILVDGPLGTDIFPLELIGDLKPGDLFSGEDRKIPAHIQSYCNNTRAYSIKVRTAYGARLSAPEYMDCTDWQLFDTIGAAESAMADDYDLCPSCLSDPCECRGIDP